jgi:hypothetical protein
MHVQHVSRPLFPLTGIQHIRNGNVDYLY